MVAKITFPKRANAALNYNENKVEEGVAECLYAANALKDAKEMNHYDKKQLLERNHDLSNVQTKNMHISLNFDPSEKLSKEKMVQIAKDYMDKIGYGNQPYLVYQHKDAAHPHIHIVTSTIDENGKKLNTHNIGINESEKARKEIEIKHGLVKADEKQNQMVDKIQPAQDQKVVYGKSQTRKEIGRVVTGVFNTYTYRSLPEYNAVLKKFNVRAERGTEESKMFKNGGMHYRVLDKDGKPVGVPIKASSLPGEPTLKILEQLFEKNKAKNIDKRQTKCAVDEMLSRKPASIDQLTKMLEEKRIDLVVRKNEQGRIYGLTYVDHENKIVFNGSDLGKQYSPKGLETIFAANYQEQSTKEIKTENKEQQQPTTVSDQPKQTASTQDQKPTVKSEENSQQILREEQKQANPPSTSEGISGFNSGEDQSAPDVKRKRKKKKRKNLRM